jgi:hypothetical protein
VCFIALLKCIIINVLIDSIFINLISNIVLYNFTIQLRNFYLNKRFTQLLNANQDNFAIVALFSIQFLFIIILFLRAIATCDAF